MTPGSRDYSDTVEIERLRAINAELLAALEGADDAFRRGEPIRGMKTIRAAIAKANRE